MQSIHWLLEVPEVHSHFAHFNGDGLFYLWKTVGDWYGAEAGSNSLSLKAILTSFISLSDGC